MHELLVVNNQYLFVTLHWYAFIHQNTTCHYQNKISFIDINTLDIPLNKYLVHITCTITVKHNLIATPTPNFIKISVNLERYMVMEYFSGSWVVT